MELWRAVDEGERSDLEARGRFRLLRGASAHKYFALSLEGARREAIGLSQLTGRPHIWIFSAEWRSKASLGARSFVDLAPGGPVESVLLAGDDLRKLGPARIIEVVAWP